MARNTLQIRRSRPEFPTIPFTELPIFTELPTLSGAPLEHAQF